jgi:hypothetical protein
VGGRVSARRITLSRFKVAGVEFRNLPGWVSQTKAGSFASRTLAGNLGGGVLRCFRLTFDYEARTMDFESPPEQSIKRTRFSWTRM